MENTHYFFSVSATFTENKGTHASRKNRTNFGPKEFSKRLHYQRCTVWYTGTKKEAMKLIITS